MLGRRQRGRRARLLPAEGVRRRRRGGDVRDGVRDRVAARGGLLVVRAAEALLEAVAVHLVLEVAHLLVDLVQDGGLVPVHLGARHRAAHARLRDLLGEEVEELVQVNVLRVVGDEGLVRPNLRVDSVCQLGQFSQLLLRVAATNIIE